MTQTLSMSALYKKLSEIGLSENYVRSTGLPSWWNDELNEQPTAVLEGAGHIAQRLHLDLKSLLTENQAVQFKPLPQTKFKYHQQQESDVPSTSHQLASRVAELVAYGVLNPYIPLPKNVDQLRADIVQQSAKVTLESLLNYCWQHGIAVVYFNEYPEKTRKITGMIQWQCDRPVIVLSSKRTHPAWLAFHLAHELAHLALGHIQEGILVDDEIDKSSNDLEEIEANKFAVKVLVNNLDNCFNGESVQDATHLADKIDRILILDPTVDPCALALNYSWHTKKYGCANKTVNMLNPYKDGHKTINNFLSEHLDWETINDDSADHLEEILGD